MRMWYDPPMPKTPPAPASSESQAASQSQTKDTKSTTDTGFVNKWLFDLAKTLIPVMVVGFACLGYIIPKMLEGANTRAVQVEAKAIAAEEATKRAIERLDQSIKSIADREKRLGELDERIRQTEARYANLISAIDRIESDPQLKDRAIQLLHETVDLVRSKASAADVLSKAGEMSAIRPRIDRLDAELSPLKYELERTQLIVRTIAEASRNLAIRVHRDCASLHPGVDKSWYEKNVQEFRWANNQLGGSVGDW